MAPTEDTATLKELAEVKGQLTNITQLLTLHHQSTNQRIDDLRHSVEGRLDGHESRLAVLEKNERGTAAKAAGTSAITSAVVAAGIAAVKHALGGG